MINIQFILIMIFCSPISAIDLISEGMIWDDVVVILNDNGWVKSFVKFELENEFASSGGRIEEWQSNVGISVHYLLMPFDGVVKVYKIEIPNKEIAGMQLRIKAFYVD